MSYDPSRDIEQHNARLPEDVQRDLRFAQRDALLTVAAKKAARLSFVRSVEVSVEVKLPT